jgi:hypothetical protein
MTAEDDISDIKQLAADRGIKPSLTLRRQIENTGKSELILAKLKKAKSEGYHGEVLSIWLKEKYQVETTPVAVERLVKLL